MGSMLNLPSLKAMLVVSGELNLELQRNGYSGLECQFGIFLPELNIG